MTARRYPLILASGSPRRRELLGELGIPFSVVVPEVDEHEDPATDPRSMVAHNAALKADWVAARHPDSLILAADTTVFIDGHALNKPASLDEARVMLRRLSGRSHSVFTGVAVRQGREGLAVDASAESEVVFRKLDDAAIEEYLRRVPVFDKAGAYAIQEAGELIVERFTGSYSNIVGLPLETTKQILTRCGLRG